MIVELDAAPDVVAVVPTLGGNTPRLLGCLESVTASEFAGRLAVVVVWNDPRRPVPELGDVTVLEPGLNLGFPGALNHARSRVDASFLWVLQDDIVVDPDCLARLWETTLRDDTLAVVSPVTTTAEGLVPARSRGGVLAGDGEMAHMFPRVDTEPDQLDPNYPLSWVASSASLVRLTAWDAVGGYDPAFYPLLWSDVDFGYRVGRAGFSSALEPSARIEHEVNASTPGILSRYLGSVQPERFRRKNFLKEAAGGDVNVDQRILVQVARSASLGMIDLASFASAVDSERLGEIRRRDDALLEVESRRAALEGELLRLRATLSWRVTAPLRAVRRLGRGRR